MNDTAISRRSFLQIGSLALGGLTLPDLFRAEAAAGIRSSQKSVIMIYLVGGPPHQDLFDLKPEIVVSLGKPKGVRLDSQILIGKQQMVRRFAARL